MSSTGVGSPRLHNGTSGRPDSRPSSRSRIQTPTEDTPTTGNTSSITSNTAGTQAPPSIKFRECGHSSVILALLNELRLHNELCDITLKLDGREFPAHRAILSANSPYFRAMFTSSYSEASQSEVELHGITPTALEVLIQFFYTSTLHVSTGNVQEVLPAACMFQVTAVKDACSEFMRRHLGVGNCLGIRAFADTHSCPKLRRLADNFAKHHFQDVVQSEEFLRMQVDQVLELFSCDDLTLQSEEQAYRAVMAWVKHDPASREKFTADLLEQVRLPLLQPAFLCDSVAKEAMVVGDPRAMKLVLEAMEFHLLPERRGNWEGSARAKARRDTTRVEVMLAMGGMGRREPMSTVEQYDPVHRQWRSQSPMVTSRWGAGVATIDNMVYVVGGSNESSRLAMVEKYDVLAGHWSEVAKMSTARNGVGVVVAGGLLYAIGGFDGVSPLRSGEKYDPKTNKWTPISDMIARRFGLGACAWGGEEREGDGMDGRDFMIPVPCTLPDSIYTIGGSDGANLNSAECYTISSDSWSAMAPMHVSRKFPGAECLGGVVYAIGGCDASSRHGSVETYIPSLNQWTMVAPLLSARSGPGTTVMDGCIYIAGGYDGLTHLSSVERYDPLTSEWGVVPHMGMARDCVGLTVVELQQTGRATSPSDGETAI